LIKNALVNVLMLHYSHKKPEILLRFVWPYFFYRGHCKYPDNLGIYDTSTLQALASCRADLDRVANFCVCVEAETRSFADELRVEPLDWLERPAYAKSARTLCHTKGCRETP